MTTLYKLETEPDPTGWSATGIVRRASVIGQALSDAASFKAETSRNTDKLPHLQYRAKKASERLTALLFLRNAAGTPVELDDNTRFHAEVGLLIAETVECEVREYVEHGTLPTERPTNGQPVATRDMDAAALGALAAILGYGEAGATPPPVGSYSDLAIEMMTSSAAGEAQR
jgi:hypothetical protein